MNFVAYSLFGDNPKYLVGALRNAARVPSAYPGFRAVFCVEAATVPRDVITQLRDLGAVCFAGSREGMYNRKLWRYSVIDFPDSNIVLTRDVDSRITEREIAAVQEWIASDFGAHVMRDFPKHTAPIMAGTFGIKKKEFPGLRIAELWRAFKQTSPDWDKDSDQIFLGQQLWPIVNSNVLEHDEFNERRPGLKPFPPAVRCRRGICRGSLFRERSRDPRAQSFSRSCPICAGSYFRIKLADTAESRLIGASSDLADMRVLKTFWKESTALTSVTLLIIGVRTTLDFFQREPREPTAIGGSTLAGFENINTG